MSDSIPRSIGKVNRFSPLDLPDLPLGWTLQRILSQCAVGLFKIASRPCWVRFHPLNSFMHSRTHQHGGGFPMSGNGNGGLLADLT
jgi:hypothetical protein